MSLRRTRAVARKEFLHIVRDPRSLIMALAVPLVMLLLFGYALSLDVDRIPTIVCDLDRSPESRALTARLAGSRYFEIVAETEKPGEVDRSVDRGESLLGLVIPRDYSRDLLSDRPARVQILLDGSDSNTASIARAYAESVVDAHAMEHIGGAPPIEARLRVWYNSDLKSKNYIVPGLIAVILMIIAALLTSLTIAREWENGSMEQLLSTPLRPAELVLGKLAAYFTLGVADALIAITIGVFVFGVPLKGSMLLLAGATCMFLFGALAWGIFLSAVARTQLLAYQMGLLTSFLPAFLLSGFIYSIDNMPAVIQAVTYVVPARYFVALLKGIFLKGVGLELLWIQAAFLVIYAAVVFLLATRKLRQKVA
jgi:ABC-2 type transport system permease protein